MEGQGGQPPSSSAPPAGTLKTPPHSPALCFQRLTAIQQVLNAQKISFLLRGGVRVVVAVRDVDTGEARARLASARWDGRASRPLRRCWLLCTLGAEGAPLLTTYPSWPGGCLQLNPGQPCCPPPWTRTELLL